MSYLDLPELDILTNLFPPLGPLTSDPVLHQHRLRRTRALLGSFLHSDVDGDSDGAEGGAAAGSGVALVQSAAVVTTQPQSQPQPQAHQHYHPRRPTLPTLIRLNVFRGPPHLEARWRTSHTTPTVGNGLYLYDESAVKMYHLLQHHEKERVRRILRNIFQQGVHTTSSSSKSISSALCAPIAKLSWSLKKASFARTYARTVPPLHIFLERTFSRGDVERASGERVRLAWCACVRKARVGFYEALTSRIQEEVNRGSR